MTHDKLKYKTKLPESYHQAFLNKVCITKQYSTKDTIKKDRNKKMMLFKRKQYLNKRFRFDKESISAFERLSHKLTSMQAEIISKYNYLSERLNAELIKNGGLFSDFNINLNIMFMCNSLGDDIDLLFESEQIFYLNLIDEDDLELINKNYADYECLNEYKKQFSHFHQSRLFHHLVMESHLALQDILMLDEIWFEIKVDYQVIHSLK